MRFAHNPKNEIDTISKRFGEKILVALLGAAKKLLIFPCVKVKKSVASKILKKWLYLD
jgi:hypothetical protein